MKNGVRLNFFVKLTILIIMCFCAVNIIRLRSEYNDLKDLEARLLIEKQEYEDAIDELIAELEAEINDDYILRLGPKFGYYPPDAIIFYTDR